MIFCFCVCYELDDKSNNEARFAGMKEEDFNWVAEHMKIFREEIAKRRNTDNTAEQGRSVRNYFMQQINFIKLKIYLV